MVELLNQGIFLQDGRTLVPDAPAALEAAGISPDAVEGAKQGTMAYSILAAHNTAKDMRQLRLKFDAMASHDITYVGIIQTARASGLTTFPLPYVLTNCHNSLCAVGGTINEDDHQFALSAAKKYGGVYVPAHLAVIHQYMREMYAGCGKMILGSDSHTRYGALGTMAIGEGGGELAKQLLGRTYDIHYPRVVCVRLTGKPVPGVGPQDVALAIIEKVFANGFVKNAVMEFVGEGIANLNVEYRCGIDVMTTETTCLSSIWQTDAQVEAYLALHGRAADYREITPAPLAYYDALIEVDLSRVRPMIALPFHPSNAYPIEEFNQNAGDILRETEKKAKEALGDAPVSLRLTDKLQNGGLVADQAVVAGCAGGSYDNIVDVCDILRGKGVPGNLTMSVYPASQPIYTQLVHNGSVETLMDAGVIMRSAFCGPCFGAGDTPANGALSLRHTTRNFPNREGSKPGEGQISAVALMDARSIAATVVNGGRLTPATALTVDYTKPAYTFRRSSYDQRVYDGFDKARPDTALVLGPNIADWPPIPPPTQDILLRVDSKLLDAVTTTDELIPSGEASSYRSNPFRLAEFTLSRRDPLYVSRAKQVRAWEEEREAGTAPCGSELDIIYEKLAQHSIQVDPLAVGIGSVVAARKPGDGSAREQAASCQRVLGGWANIAQGYATKRYRTNLINWGILPFTIQGEFPFEMGDFVYLRGVRTALERGEPKVQAVVVGDTLHTFDLLLEDLSEEERRILLAGCLINYYRAGN